MKLKNKEYSIGILSNSITNINCNSRYIKKIKKHLTFIKLDVR